MKKPRFSESQILAILKQAETGTPVPDLCREHGISTATFYKWRSKFGGMDASLMARLKSWRTSRRCEAMQSTSTIDCDVIIVNYNAGGFLAHCVASVLPEVSGRVIVVDNASVDGSVAEAAARFSADRRVDIIRKGENTGFAAACNTGIGASHAPYLLFLNPDCQVRSGSLQRMMAVLAGDGRAGMVGGLLLGSDGTEQPGGRRAVPTPWRAFVRAFGLHRLGSRWPLFSDVNLHEQPLPSQPVEVEAVSGALMLVRRAALDDVGAWDEGYFLHCEDLDWCMRFRQRGWQILFVPDAPVVHEKGVCSRSRPMFVEWHKHRGMARFYRKFFRDRYPLPLMWLVYAGVWLRFALVAATLAARARQAGRRAGG